MSRNGHQVVVRTQGVVIEMANLTLRLKRRGWGETLRTDAWWIAPLAVFIGLGAFLIWANFRVFEGDHYFSGHSPIPTNQTTNYLTPFYSPLVFEQPKYVDRPSQHAWFLHKPGWLAWLPSWVSPAALILIFPAGFRFTCYYYRGAYYKAFWADPPSCAVGEPRKSYWGENSFPLILQNIHRYFLYMALLFLFLLAYDVYQAMWFKGSDGQKHFGIGVGTLVLAANVVLLSGYTCGCHSLRHLVGGFRDEMSKSPTSSKMYNCVTCLNKRHMIWAWCSLISVGFSDIYVRQCAIGAWIDYRIL